MSRESRLFAASSPTTLQNALTIAVADSFGSMVIVLPSRDIDMASVAFWAAKIASKDQSQLNGYSAKCIYLMVLKLLRPTRL